MKALTFLSLFLCSLSLSAATEKKSCQGNALSCSVFNGSPFSCLDQTDCTWDDFGKLCIGKPKKCNKIRVKDCEDQQGCYVNTVIIPNAYLSNFFITNSEEGTVSPEQKGELSTTNLYHINLDETNRSTATWSNTAQPVTVEFTNNPEGPWNTYEEVTNTSSVTLCHSGVRLSKNNYCYKMPKLYRGKVYYRFKIGDADNWIYIDAISFYYNS